MFPLTSTTQVRWHVQHYIFSTSTIRYLSHFTWWKRNRIKSSIVLILPNSNRRHVQCQCRTHVITFNYVIFLNYYQCQRVGVSLVFVSVLHRIEYNKGARTRSNRIPWWIKTWSVCSKHQQFQQFQEDI